MFTLNGTEVHAVAIGLDCYNQNLTGVSKPLTNKATDSDHVPCVIMFDHHPADSRASELGEVANSVVSKYGTGGGNTPIVVEIYEEDKSV